MPATDRTAPLAATGAGADAPELSGRLFGRYAVLQKLGSGGAGRVYSAYDTQLDRRVALKVLDADEHPQEAAWARTVREARTIAQLSHPNVLVVHEAGWEDDTAFIATELVDGGDLATWLAADRDRTRAEILALFIAAGRGLQAAHESGVVHGDFKPANVLVGSDGRPRVADFGVARLRAEGPPHAATDGPEQGTADGTVPLTGTPYYMAPEQWAGERASERSDQYAFCLALVEALRGAPVFTAKGIAALAAAKAGPIPAAPATARRVPAWLDAVLRRGMSSDPRDRYPSITAVLGRIHRLGRQRRVLRNTGAAIAAVGVATSLGLGAWRLDAHQRAAACEAEATAIDGTWSDGPRDLLRARLLETELPYAEVAVDKALPWLDKRAQDWRVHRGEVCENLEITRTWDQALRGAADWCFEQRRSELQAAVSVLADVQPATVHTAVRVASGDTPVSVCADAVALERMPPPPDPAHRDDVAEILRDLAHARALQVAGDFDPALALVEQVQAPAEAIAWAPLLAAARVRHADLLEETASYDEAETMAVNAYLDAAAASDWGHAASAASLLTKLVGMSQARPAEGETWARHATVAIAQAGDPAGLREATRLRDLAAVRHAQGQHDEAVTLLEEVAERYRSALGEGYPGIAAVKSNLGMELRQAGRFREAAQLQEQALAAARAALGDGHPSVGVALVSLGSTRAEQGSVAQARRLFEQGLALLEQAYGSEHPHVAAVLTNLGNLAMQADDDEGARAAYERALAIFEATPGGENEMMAACLANLANLLEHAGEVDEGVALAERSLEIRTRRFGADHVGVGHSLLSLGRLLRAAGKYDAAVERFERARAIWEAKLPPEHPNLALAWTNLGNVHASLGHHQESVDAYARALQITEASQGPKHSWGRAAFLLAKALWAAPAGQGGDRARATALAREARVAVSAGEAPEKDLARVDAWLEEHA